MKYVFLFLTLLGFISHGKSQVQVQIDRPRVNYLLYEPVILEVMVKNQSGKTLELGKQDSSWLRFLVKRSNGLLARQVQEFFLPPLTLEPGDSARFKFDLMPYYGIREVDSYEVSALVEAPGSRGDFTSQKVIFSVVKGTPIWTERIGLPDTNEQRTYSLISQLVEDRVTLYAQIESEDQNTVLLCKPLGFLMSGEKPQSEIEIGNSWHVLFRSGANQFHYFNFSLEGQILKQERYASIETRPRLINQEGKWEVIGGVSAEEMRSETLSQEQPSEATHSGSR